MNHTMKKTKRAELLSIDGTEIQEKCLKYMAGLDNVMSYPLDSDYPLMTRISLNSGSDAVSCNHFPEIGRTVSSGKYQVVYNVNADAHSSRLPILEGSMDMESLSKFDSIADIDLEFEMSKEVNVCTVKKFDIFTHEDNNVLEDVLTHVTSSVAGALLGQINATGGDPDKCEFVLGFPDVDKNNTHASIMKELKQNYESAIELEEQMEALGIR